MTKESFLADLLGRLSVEEKAGQLNLLSGEMDATGAKHSAGLHEKIRSGKCGGVFNVFTPPAVRELQQAALQSNGAIPLLFGYDVIHGHRTIFPIPLALSCSWNPSLVERCADVAAKEASADGLNWVFSPMADISHDARWGRVAEGSGEDPWLGARMSAAAVAGYQGSDLSDRQCVAACLKHFALYGAPTGGRDYNSVDMSRRQMEETYFPPYRSAIDAEVRTVMTSFNDINGVPASSNRWLLTDLLRGEWKFGGCVVTDYTAVGELKNHGTAVDDSAAAAQSFSAGVDMDMVSEAFLNELPDLVSSGKVPIQWLDAAVMRILELKWDLGLFADPFLRCDATLPAKVHLSAEHRALAREAARESMVLLKNEGSMLPLVNPGTLAVIGPLADSRRDMLGCWIAAGRAEETVSILEGLRGAFPENEILHAPGSGIEQADAEMMEQAIVSATAADTVVLVLGESWQMSGESASRTRIRLPKCQRKLARAILATGKPCVLISMSGRPLNLSREAENFPAILHAWSLGTEGGHAVADVLSGRHAPLGKLTMGFPRHVGQMPMTYREKSTGRPFESDVQYTTRYLDSANSPLYPFGHGLTYGALEISDPALENDRMESGGSVRITVLARNPGKHPVTDTIQLYLRDCIASFTRPVKELRGYQRVTLEPGESLEVTFELHDADLAFPGPDLRPIVEPGEFIAMVGTSSAEVKSVRFTRLPDN